VHGLRVESWRRSDCLLQEADQRPLRDIVTELHDGEPVLGSVQGVMIAHLAGDKRLRTRCDDVAAT
jgi:hypothetical protein